MPENKKRKVHALYGNEKHLHEFSLSLFQFDENGVIIIYSPALDLSGYGKTTKEAEHSFEEALNEFTRYTSNKGSLIKELKRLGWIISKKSRSAPKLENMLAENPYLSEIFEQKDFKKYNSKVQMAVPA